MREIPALTTGKSDIAPSQIRYTKYWHLPKRKSDIVFSYPRGNPLSSFSFSVFVHIIFFFAWKTSHLPRIVQKTNIPRPHFRHLLREIPLSSSLFSILCTYHLFFLWKTSLTTTPGACKQWYGFVFGVYSTQNGSSTWPPSIGWVIAKDARSQLVALD